MSTKPVPKPLGMAGALSQSVQLCTELKRKRAHAIKGVQLVKAPSYHEQDDRYPVVKVPQL